MPSLIDNWKTFIDKRVSLQSENFPDRYVRHRTMEAWLDAINFATASNVPKADSTFYIRSAVGGLGADYDGLISFESTNYPNHYLSVQNGLLFLRKNVDFADYHDRDAFNQSVGFYLNKGLIVGGDDSATWVSIRQDNEWSHANSFIRHVNFRLNYQVDDESPTFKRDATFKLVLR